MWSEIGPVASDVGFPRVSLYLPTHRRGPEVQQARIRLKNLLRAVEADLEAAGMRRPEVASLLEPAWDRLADDTFWEHQSGGLALFVRPGAMSWRELPIEVAEQAVVGARFHLRPLIAHLSRNDRYLVLAVSRGGTRLLEGTARGLVAREVEGLPTDLDEVRDRIDFDDDLGFHPNSRGAGHRGGEGGAAGAPQFHALGRSPEDYADVLLEGFVAETAAAIDAALHDSDLPLVLAGGPKVLGWLRRRLTYAAVVPEGLVKNVAALDDAALHAETWPLVEPTLQATNARWLERLGRVGAGVPGSHDLDEIVAAAHAGRVAALFLDPDAHVWGRYDEGTGAVHHDDTPGPTREDLLDLAAVRTLAAGGSVVAAGEGGPPGPASAVFRY